VLFEDGMIREDVIGDAEISYWDIQVESLGHGESDTYETEWS
jgi:hypothetical protein